MKLFRNLKVKKMLKQIDNTLIIKFGKRLECEPTENTIYIAYTTDKIDRETFMEYVKELDPQCTFDDITLGILHEIGHCFTHNEDLEDDYNLCVELLSKLCQEQMITDTDLNRMYVRLDLEKMATEWALEFARNNREFVQRLAKLVM